MMYVLMTIKLTFTLQYAYISNTIDNHIQTIAIAINCSVLKRAFLFILSGHYKIDLTTRDIKNECDV